MPSKKRSKLPKPTLKNAEIKAFVAVNQQSIAELLTFIDFAANQLTICFVEINFGKDREDLINIIKYHPQCQNIQLKVCDFSDSDVRFLRDTLVEQLAKIHIDPAKKLVLVIVGLERSIGMMGEYPPILQDLNFVRDAFRTSVPHPILLFLPDYALTRLAKYAPDFWAWRAGVFRFETAQSTKEYALEKTLDSQRIIGGLELPEKQERIDLLQRLLMEYCPSNHETVANVQTKITILYQLGVSYRSIGEVKKAEDIFQAALALIDDNKDLIKIKAAILHELGILYDCWGEVEKAITYYQQSLELTERIGDLQGKAATLHCLATIYAKTGEIEQALLLFQHSLELKERIDNVQGKAATLHNLADIYVNTGQIEQALLLVQQSLELNERLGNVQGKAATLHQLAIIYATAGEIEQALLLFQHSLELKERIGDVQGKAATLHCLATIYAKTGEIEQAIALFQQSLELNERIGNVQGKVMTLWWLGTLAADASGNFTIALDYLQQSWEILQRLKSPDAEEVRKTIVRVQQMAENSANEHSLGN